MKIVFFNTINIPQKIPAMHFLSGQSIQRSDPSFAAAFHKLVHLRSRLFPAKQKVGNHLFIKRHPTTSIDFNFYFLFLGFGAGNSSYMALNRLLIKPVSSAISYMPTISYELPYEGAKEMLLVDEVDSKQFLTCLFKAMYEELPAPKPRKRK